MIRGLITYEDRAYLVLCTWPCPPPKGWVPSVAPDGSRCLQLIGGCGHSAKEWVLEETDERKVNR